MRKSRGRDIMVGAVVLLAAFLFTIGIFSIGSEQRVWVRKVSYLLHLPEANGLQTGSPVRLAGVQVGTITGVQFSDERGMPAIVVNLSVEQAHQHRIRKDTFATVKILTLLGGERYVELTPGSAEAEALPEGSVIPVPETFGIEQLGELSEGLAADLTSISSNVRIILESVQKQEGVIGRMLLDPNFGEVVFDDIGRTAHLARETLESIHAGRGMAGRLAMDDAFASRTMESISNSLGRIESLLERATEADGVLDRVLDPNGRIAMAVDNVYQASADIQDFAADLKEGGGLVGRMVGDEELADEITRNLRSISENLAAITTKLNQGEGTLGALINDPQLHQDLQSVVRGVQDSRLMSWLIRHYRRKGEKADAREEKRRLEEEGKHREREKKRLPDDDASSISGISGGGS